jgi:hypothetical protein
MKKNEILKEVQSMQDRLAKLTQLLVDSPQEETTPELENFRWYSHRPGGWVIFKTESKKGFGWNKEGRWVDVGEWNFSFDEYPNHWEEVNTDIIIEKLKVEAEKRYKEGNWIDQSKAYDGRGLKVKLEGDVWPTVKKSGDGLNVQMGTKGVFNTSIGLWAPVCEPQSYKLKEYTWYTHKVMGDVLLYHTTGNHAFGFYGNQGWVDKSSWTMDSTPLKWEEVDIKLVHKTLKDYVKKNYKAGDVVMVNGKTHRVFEYSESDIIIFSGKEALAHGSGVVVTISYTPLLISGTWAKKVNDRELLPISWGSEGHIQDTNGVKFVVYDDVKMPVGWFISYDKDNEPVSIRLKNKKLMNETWLGIRDYLKRNNYLSDDE